MLKYLGLFLLFLGCLSLGLSKSRGLKKRLELLFEFRRVLLLLSGEIRCIHSPLPEAFQRVGKKVAEPYGSFFLTVAGDMEAEIRKPLGEIFLKNQHFFLGTALIREDRDMILELGRQLGYLDIDMQLRTLTLYGEMLEEILRKAEGDYSEKAKMYRYLGALAGLFLAVLLV